MSESVPFGLTRNTERLLRGLVAMGAELGDAKNFYIVRYPGQPAMNRAAGEIGMTWQMFQDGESFYMPRKRRWLHHGGRHPTVRFEGREYHSLGSYQPLTWILKHPSSEWQLWPVSESQLHLLVDADPPGWS